MDHRISVIVPAYNREKTIAYSLESILNQTHKPYEIIVVDDCSTDNTREVVLSICKKNNFSIKIRYVCLLRNSGAQAARNRGIKEAEGTWIAFLDSDDKWLMNKLELQMVALREINYSLMSVVHGDCLVDLCNGCDATPWRLFNGATSDGVHRAMLAEPGPMFQAMLTSKLALETIGYLDEKVPSYQEWDTAIALSKHCKFIHLSEPLFVYYLHGGETISKDHRRDVDGYQYIIEKYKKDIQNFCGRSAWQNHIKVQIEKQVKFCLWEDARIYLTKNREVPLGYRYILLYIIYFKGRGKLFLRVYNFIQKNGLQGGLFKLFKKMRRCL